MQTFHSFNIFNCWQSDDPKSRTIIKSVLAKVQKELKDKGYLLNIVEGASGTIGMPKIDEMLLKNIEECDIFICDLTPVIELKKKGKQSKAMPNSNVLFETGYAFAKKGTNRIIALARNNRIGLDTLPFDIRQYRLKSFRTNDDLKDLSLWVELIIDNILKESKAPVEYEADVVNVGGGQEFKGTAFYKKLVYDKDGVSGVIESGILINGKTAWERPSFFNNIELVNLSFLPINLVIQNKGLKMLQNCKLYISADNKSVIFRKTNLDDNPIHNIEFKTDSLHIDNNCVCYSGNSINPGDCSVIDCFYVKVPRDITEFYINWKLTSHVSKRFEGKIKILINHVLLPHKINYHLRESESDIIDFKARPHIAESFMRLLKVEGATNQSL